MKKKIYYWGGVALAMLPFTHSNAQNPGIRRGAQVIEQQATALQAYFQPVTTIIYVIAAIVGLIGGFRIYSKWQNGDQDTQKAAVGWMGAILFILAIAATLQAVFF
ncbi:MAG: DUF4134 domain-containing protein [Runella slithyformis]|nr:MAG: DUF4134 domain-containing protein [Runella slithyformis]TAE99984.1 MAG: DUF4134 domain-containing protein [Runella slithyformis]TAF27557.1 MAG: DUF4134 domain-containing protein [Runella slithyformis]TAF46071.1 MAG: DUF4134 domain-containing protein [Runella slithyformis]TAF82253.1 MAG: DUF4134 domain-containing protein [Runella slithyformis]